LPTLPPMPSGTRPLLGRVLLRPHPNPATGLSRPYQTFKNPCCSGRRFASDWSCLDSGFTNIVLFHCLVPLFLTPTLFSPVSSPTHPQSPQSALASRFTDPSRPSTAPLSWQGILFGPRSARPPPIFQNTLLSLDPQSSCFRFWSAKPPFLPPRRHHPNVLVSKRSSTPTTHPSVATSQWGSPYVDKRLPGCFGAGG